MSRFDLFLAVLTILWGSILLFLLLKGSYWHRSRAKFEDSTWLRRIRETASIWMLLLALGLCCLIALVLLSLVQD